MDKDYHIIAIIESYENIITESGAVTLYVTPDYNLTPDKSLALTVQPPRLDIIQHLGDQYCKPWSFHYVGVNLNEFQKLYQEVKNKTLDDDALEVKHKIDILRAGISKAIVGGQDFYIWKISFPDDAIFTNNSWSSICKFNKLGKEVCDYFTENGLELSSPKFKLAGAGVHSWNEVTISGWK